LFIIINFSGGNSLEKKNILGYKIDFIICIFVFLLMISVSVLLPSVGSVEYKYQEPEKKGGSLFISDFDLYWEDYKDCIDFFRGSWENKQGVTPWWFRIISRFYGFRKGNYHDWNVSVNDEVGKIWSQSTFFTMVAAFSSFFGNRTSAIVGFFLVGFYLLTAASALGYIQNGHNKFHRLLEHEIDIILHIRNKNGTDITGLHQNGGIKAINVNALDNSSDRLGYNFTLFEYYLKPIDGNQSTSGWYSLHARDNPKYKKAPCPPGKWNISIFPTGKNDIYMEQHLQIQYVESSGVVILDNVTLIKNK
jgi:hypothetical protein